MEPQTGICTKCGVVVSLPHECSDVQAQLTALDLKLIRPLSEGDSVRVAAILAQKDALRKSA